MSVDETKPGEPAGEIVSRCIRGASLCLRFYRSDGWSREEVRQLLREDKRLARVCPRYRDWRDEMTKDSFELDDGLPHDDCSYFAVYGVSDPFSAELLSRHNVM